MRSLSELIQKYKSALDKLIHHKIELSEINRIHITDRNKSFFASQYKTAHKELVSYSTEDKNVTELLDKLNEVTNPLEINEILDELAKHKPIEKSEPETKKSIHFKISNVPEELADEVYADLTELEKCFNQDCFRASVILCGRLLEVAMHRKYFTATKKDLLEKSPGIGLGNLVKKMREENIDVDPALSQQIHLINQVRIYSVHKKQSSFSPNKDQAQAIILYTLDAVRKLL